MKRKLQILVSFLMLLGIISFNSYGQRADNEVIYPTSFSKSLPLRDIVKQKNAIKHEVVREVKESSDRQHRIPQIFMFSPADGPEYGNDPALLQTEMGKRKIDRTRDLLTNWAGLTDNSGFRPFDPTGAVGLNYYIQIINATTYKIFNKTTGANVLTGTLGDIWSPATANAGDPIVMYDKYADRWFLSQFGDNTNDIYIAISETGDPTGAYYTYTFTSAQFPDYLKFSIWHDGYYMTSNQSTDRVYCFERDEMLVGNPSARAVSATFSTGSVSAFFVPLPADAADGGLPASGTPLPFFAYYDNAWGGGTDGVKIWNMTVNWTSGTASISSATQVNTSAFDAQYNSSWNDVTQPGTTQKLDGIGGVPTYRAQWRPWSGYNSLLLNWGVYLSSTQRSIMWVELRQNQSTGTWSLYQEGVYTPDAHTRWLGSIAMDDNGSVGLAYLKSSSSVYPSLCYTGRLASDPLGEMSFAEVVVQAGTSSQTGVNRVGDYSHTSLDPSDGLTFWHTGEYISSGAKTRVFSFQIPMPSVPPTADFSGTPTTLEAGSPVTFTDLSTENPTSWLWTFEGGTPATSTEQNPVVVYNTPGTYNVSLYVENPAGNDTEIKNNYITVNVLSSPPTADFTADNTTVIVGQTVNFTDMSNNAPTSWAWTFNGATPSSSTAQNPSVVYSAAGTYNVTLVATNTIGSSTPVTKTSYITVTLPSYCDAAATTSDEYISNVTFGNINNTSTFDGYADNTNLSTAVDIDGVYPISITNAIYYSLDQVLVWVDWNIDGDFEDAGELVLSDVGGGTTTNNPYISSGNITVPSTASVGTTRMRVRLHYNSATYNGNDTPCGNTDYGDVEDYTIVVNAPAANPPVADFSGTPTTLEEGNSVTFTDLSTENPTSWLWTFEGGTPATSTAQNPVVLYSTAGTYNVTLYVENTAGNDTKNVNNYITVTVASNSPVADFSADATNITVGTTVNFTDLSTNGPTSWAWTFNGGTPASSTSQNPSVVYNTAGTYDVTLTATNAVGSSTPVTKTGYIVVSDAPVAGFSLDFEACADYSTDFTPWSSVDGDGITTYGSNDFDWTGESTAFGFMAFNPAAAALATPIATTHGGDRCGMAISPSDASQADDWLISDLLSLENSSSISFWVLTVKDTWGLEDFEVLVSTTDNQTTSFSVLPDGAAQQAPNTWTEMTYDLSAYDNQDIYVAVHYTSTDKFMFYIDDISINTSPTVLVPPVAAFSATPTTLCAGGTVSFTNESTGADSYAWTFVGGTPSTSTSANPSVVYATAGTYNVVLEATNTDGTTTETKTSYIVVNAIPTVTASTTDNNICVGELVTLTGGGASSYTWSNSVVDGVAFAPANTTTYTVTGTTNGCSNTANVTVNVYAAISLTLTPTNATVYGASDGSIDMTISGGSSPYSILWSNSATTEDISGLVADTYTVDVSDTYGCVASSSATVNQPPLSSDMFEIPEIMIYPNPTRGYVHIKSLESGHIFIYNVLGQEMLNIEITSDATNIDMSKYIQGNYIVKVVTDKQVKSVVLKVIR